MFKSLYVLVTFVMNNLKKVIDSYKKNSYVVDPENIFFYTIVTTAYTLFKVNLIWILTNETIEYGFKVFLN